MTRLRVILLALSLFWGADATAEPWREASSAHFVIYAQYTPGELRAYAERLERFDKALRVLRRLPDPPVGDANRLTIFVVRNNEAVAKLAGAANSNIVGFYRSRAGASTAVTSRQEAQHWTELTPEVTLLHEYAHHFMLRNFPAAYPAWFREGFAEFYSTARFAPDGGIDVGEPANHRAYEFAVVRRPNVPLMLSDPDNTARIGSMELYSYGWLITHYLTFSEARKGQLAAYLDSINRGQPARKAAVDAFGDLNQFEREVRVYLAKRRMKTARLTPAELAIGPIDIRELGPGEAAMTMTAIRASLVEVDKVNRDVASDAREVAANWPQDAKVATLLAEAELAGGNLNAANDAADRAIAADPKALRAVVVKAEVALRQAAAAGSAEEKRRLGGVARQFARQANRSDPDHPVPLIQFYRSFAAAGETPSANAVAGLTRAHLLAPEDADLNVLLARQMIADAKPEEARTLLTPIAYDPHAGKQRDAAVTLLAKLPASGAVVSGTR